jgi:hypothetical protein
MAMAARAPRGGDDRPERPVKAPPSSTSAIPRRSRRFIPGSPSSPAESPPAIRGGARNRPEAVLQAGPRDAFGFQGGKPPSRPFSANGLALNEERPGLAA